MSFKENDIRPEELMEKKKPALLHDINFLLERIDSFITVDCVACGSKNHVFWAKKAGFTYHQCKDCNTQFMNPRADDETLGEFYKQSQNYAFWNKHIFPASEAVRKQKIFIPRAGKTIDLCRKYEIPGSGTLLEIGSAFGTYCDSVRELGFFKRIVAVEPTPDLAETCRKKGIETFEQTIEGLEFEEGTADVLASFEVIEHLGNPAMFIQSASRFLKKGGLFICTCPSGSGIGTLVLKEKSKVVDHEHVNYFNPKSLPLLLNRCGLETLEVSTPGELDAELLYNEFLQQPDLFKDELFFQHLFSHTREDTLSDLQEFLKKNHLSSHLWVVARKR
jgi:SAM-dependent methyltransferase